MKFIETTEGISGELIFINPCQIIAIRVGWDGGTVLDIAIADKNGSPHEIEVNEGILDIIKQLNETT